MSETNNSEKKDKYRWLKLLLKIVVTAICLWYVSGKINFKEAGEALWSANWWCLLFAMVLFISSKIIAAIRLNIYFKNIGIHLPQLQNLQLYWLGMFYNLFLPGSISGDAYKVVLLTKKFAVPYKKTASAVLLDRFSGLLGLGIILSVYGTIVLNNSLYSVILIGGAIASIIFLYLLTRYYFKDFLPGFTPTLLLGIVVQLLQVFCAYLIMAALGIPTHVTEYIFIFLVSSVASVLPIAIGGLGIREIVFLEGAKYFNLTQSISVIISLLFYLITLVTSAVGMLYIFKDPLKQKKSPH